MKKSATFLFLSVFLVLNFSPRSFSQDDCCGLGSIFTSVLQSGVFAGYGLQQYDAKGLNAVLTSGAFKDYGQAWGWRLGANVIQVRQSNTLVGLKFYYQSLTEKQDRVESTFNEEIALEIKQWNFGMSISYIVSQAFDIRALDAYISWTSAKLTNNYSNTENPEENVYESPESNIGITADVGIVWYPIPTATFMSLEVLGGYSYFTVDKVTLKEGNSSLTTIEEIIDGGGFFATAVFTIGIPFN